MDFFTWHTFLEVGKTQDLPSKICQTLVDARSYQIKKFAKLKIANT
jgi:hypothetical protein